jgi:hypothetical protein
MSDTGIACQGKEKKECERGLTLIIVEVRIDKCCVIVVLVIA